METCTQGSLGPYCRNALFEGLPTGILTELGLPVVEVRFAERAIIFDEDDPGKDLYLLREGQIRISKTGRLGEQETLRMVNPGGFFGEMAILDGQRRSARATAMSNPSVVGVLGRDAFDRFLVHSPETARHFAKVLSRQRRSANASFIDTLRQSERLSLLGTMMSSIVHDIRNPVATLGQVGYFLRTQEEQPKLVNLGRTTEEAVDQITTMIQELLDYSRGTIALEREEFTVKEFLASLDQHIFCQMESRGITINREIEYEGIITGDRLRLFRLFLNIIKNSWEAMNRNGKGGPDADAADATLTLRARRSGNTMKFEIEDTGCGINPEILRQVFTPFVTHGKKDGTGLGMAIAKSVIEAHEGTIHVESEVGKGTTCYLTLPV